MNLIYILSECLTRKYLPCWTSWRLFIPDWCSCISKQGFIAPTFLCALGLNADKSTLSLSESSAEFEDAWTSVSEQSEQNSVISQKVTTPLVAADMRSTLLLLGNPSWLSDWSFMITEEHFSTQWLLHADVATTDSSLVDSLNESNLECNKLVNILSYTYTTWVST